MLESVVHLIGWNPMEEARKKLEAHAACRDNILYETFTPLVQGEISTVEI